MSLSGDREVWIWADSVHLGINHSLRKYIFGDTADKAWCSHKAWRILELEDVGDFYCIDQDTVSQKTNGVFKLTHIIGARVGPLSPDPNIQLLLLLPL